MIVYVDHHGVKKMNLDKWCTILGALLIIGGVVSRMAKIYFLSYIIMMALGITLLIITGIFREEGDETSLGSKEEIPRISLMGNCCSHDTTIQDYNKVSGYNRNQHN